MQLQHVIKLKLSSQLIGQFGHVTASASCKQPEKHGIDYVTRIGNSSRAPIVIVDFATAHPSCDFLPNLGQDSSSSHRRSRLTIA